MEPSKSAEFRLRLTIDNEMPELYERLISVKRQCREAIHLMRMGIQWERERIQKEGLSVQSQLYQSATASAGNFAQGAAISLSGTLAGINDNATNVLTFADSFGITADYFCDVPPDYSEK